LERALDEPVLPERLPILEQSLDGSLRRSTENGFSEIVAGAPSERGNAVSSARTHHDDHRGARAEHARSLEHLEAVESRHDDVGDDDVEVLLLDAFSASSPLPAWLPGALGGERPSSGCPGSRARRHTRIGRVITGITFDLR